MFRWLEARAQEPGFRTEGGCRMVSEFRADFDNSQNSLADRVLAPYVARNTGQLMRIKVQHVGCGPRPHDIVIELNTASGPQRLVVNDSTIEDSSLAIGYPLRRDDRFVFVALPGITTKGSYRVWIPAQDIVPD
jgi:hypothetical protein